MRILTVRPPWAQAIIFGDKNVENRPRNIAGKYRGLVAIHAGKSLAKLTPDQTNLLGNVDALEPWFWGEDIVGGAIIGVVALTDAHHVTRSAHPDHPGTPLCWDGHTPSGEQCSPWAESMYDGWHLELSTPRPLNHPIPYKGALGLRTLPDDIAALIELELT